MFINEFQEKIWKDKYQYKDETYEQFCDRIANTIFIGEADKAARLKESIMDFRTLFGGRINSNIGVDEGGLTLFNCYIAATIKHADSLEGILDALKNYALTLKTEGGVGFCANFLRPAKTIIRKIGVTSPGSIRFLDLFDKISEVITSGSVSTDDSFQGTPTKKSIRKGATMVTMSANHPDIEDFITAKSVPNKLTKMNMSVLITDAFMYCVQNNLDWSLWFPDITFDKYDEEWNGDFEQWAEKGYPTVTYRTVSAVKLWELLLRNSFNRNEPGILFIDNIRRMDNISYLPGCSILACNPCMTKNTILHTDKGMERLYDLYKRETPNNVYIDNRKIDSTLGTTLLPATHVYKTGIEPVFKLTTKSGYSIEATEYHRFPTDEGDKELKDLKVGDKLRVCSGECGFGSNGDLAFGRIIGLVAGDGTIYKGLNKQTKREVHKVIIRLWGKDKELAPYIVEVVNNLIELYGERYSDERVNSSLDIKTDKITIQSGVLYRIFEKFDLLNIKKEVPAFVFTGSRDCVIGYLQGLFQSDGSISIGKRSRAAVQVNSSMPTLLNDVQILLANFGIHARQYLRRKSSYRLMPDGKGGSKEYLCKDNYDLMMHGNNLHIFMQKIGFLLPYKNDKYLTFVGNQLDSPYLQKYTDPIITIEPLGKQDVYCLTQPEYNSIICNGVSTMNCAEVTSNTGVILFQEKLIELGDVCNLGSLNVTRYYDMKTKLFNTEQFLLDIDLMVEALDNVIDISNYPLPMYEDAAKLKRKIGLGICGIGSWFMMMGVKYGSDDSILILKDLLSKFMNRAYQASALLARERGPFALYDNKVLECGYVKNSGVLTDKTIDMIRTYGLRHCALSAIAPNGSLSILAGNVSGGLEPVFSPEFNRWNRVEGKTVDFIYPLIHKGEWYETDYFKEEMAFGEAVLYSTDGNYRIDKNQGLCKKHTIRDYGYNLAKEYGLTEFTSATELSVTEHLKVLSVFASHVDLSCSKCVEVNTRINTNKGIKKIKDLSDNRVLDTFTPIESLSVSTETTVQKSDSFYYNGVVDGKQITTSNGMSLSGSLVHKIRVISDDLSMCWKSLNDIQAGDIIPIKLGADISEIKTISQIIGKPFVKSPNCNPVTIPTQLTSDLLWWLGCLMADGNVNSIGAHLTQVSGPVMDKYIAVTKKLFDRDVVVVKDKRKKSLYKLCLNSKIVYEWLQYIGFSKDSVSELVFCATKALKKSFLEGITLDGYLTDNRICLKTDKNEQVIKDLQTIATAVGIPTYLSSKFNTIYNKYYFDLMVAVEHVNKLNSFVFPEEHKQKKLIELCSKKVSEKSGAVAFIDTRLPINDYYKELSSSTEKRVFYSSSLYNIFHKLHGDAKRLNSLTLSQLKTLCVINNCLPDFMMDSDILLVKVEDAKSVRIETADISVEEDHHYIANGFISHNTINLPKDISFEEFSSLYGDIYKYGIKGCTTYREGTSIAVLETKKEVKEQVVKEQQNEFLDAFKNHYNGEIIQDIIKLPEEYPSKGYILRAEKKKFYIHVAFKDIAMTKPFAIFVNTNDQSPTLITNNAIDKLKELAIDKGLGNGKLADVEEKFSKQKNSVKIARMLGYLLRHNVQIIDIVQALDRVEDAHIGTFVFRIKKFLMTFITEPIAYEGMSCPSCGGHDLILQEGCVQCRSCFYSACG